MKFKVGLVVAAIGPSLLSWERGLKFVKTADDKAPEVVAPLVGAWIEIFHHAEHCCREESLLSWERGLKYTVCNNQRNKRRRSSRGSVD